MSCVCSGSETAHGFVWSRDYGCSLGVLEHEQTVSAVAMNPRDEQMCVSVSDDYTIKVSVLRVCRFTRVDVGV
jgi:hypothetical protein